MQHNLNEIMKINSVKRRIVHCLWCRVAVVLVVVWHCIKASVVAGCCLDCVWSGAAVCAVASAARKAHRKIFYYKLLFVFYFKCIMSETTKENLQEAENKVMRKIFN